MSDTRDDQEMVRLVTLNITGMTCQSCVTNIETSLRELYLQVQTISLLPSQSQCLSWTVGVK